MHEYSEGYVAFIDVLGFKELVLHEKCEEIFNRLNEVFQFKIPLFAVYDKTEHVNYDRSKIHTYVFSDSVCIFVEESCKGSLGVLMFICMELQSRLFGMNPPTLLRGAITKGKVFCSGEMMYGPGLVEAYQLEGKAALVPRIITTRFLIEEFINKFGEFPPVYFEDYDEFYSLDYVWYYGEMARLGEGESLESRLAYIQSVLASTTNTSIRDKYLYLKQRVCFCIDRLVNEGGCRD